MPTPIEEAMNIGPMCGAELRSIGIEHVEQLEDLGWEEVYERWVSSFPDRIHTMAAYALLGAEAGVNCLHLSDAQKARAKAVVRRIKADYK